MSIIYMNIWFGWMLFIFFHVLKKQNNPIVIIYLIINNAPRGERVGEGGGRDNFIKI